MKWLFAWIVIFVISWGLGIILCGIALWNKNYKFAKIAAIVLFGLPVVFLGADLILQKMILNDFEYAKKEVARLCALDGGDKIYKTVDNVQGVFQMRLRQPESSRDEKGRYRQWMSDQYGMEDPYGMAQNDRSTLESWVGESSIRPNSPPRGKQGYWFIEQQPKYGALEGALFRRTYLVDSKKSNDPEKPTFVTQQVDVTKLKSRYGYLTEDLTTKEMRDHWIGAGRIKIIDLQTNEVLAERKGYFRASGDMLPDHGDRWTASGAGGQGRICPEGGVLKYVHAVLKPPQNFPNNEQLESIAKD